MSRLTKCNQYPVHKLVPLSKNWPTWEPEVWGECPLNKLYDVTGLGYRVLLTIPALVDWGVGLGFIIGGDA